MSLAPRSGGRGTGCPECNNSGFSGRTAIVELWTPSVEEGILINKKCTPEMLRESALSHTMSLAEDALIKAMTGQTTLEEALRIVPFEDIQHTRRVGIKRVRNELERIGECALDEGDDTIQEKKLA